ncbi:hypothetical protein [Endobacterium cereale]|uniref:hypothetical protein n=1 Tax=Endobacterium cereale TaxID=2663029 RepID=UPI002B48C9A4|nr:hypothetical protein [Endobacterium cereale]MEB2843810.1 hypothetical protein [Endobacterium cereale]
MASTPKNTTTTTEPWSGSKQYLLQQYADFDKLLKEGAPKAYDGQTYSDQSQATKDANAQAEAIARGGDTSTLTNATNAVNGVMNQSGTNQSTNTLSQLQNGMSLGTNPTNSYANSVMNGQTAAAPGTYNQNWQNAALGAQQSQANSLASGNNPAMGYLQQTASGANIGNNPWLQQNIATQQANIADQLKNVTNPGIASQAASLGRSNSGAFATQRNNAETTAAKAMSDVAVNALQGQYNQDLANQMSAAGQIGNFYNSDVANSMNANQALSNTSNAQQTQNQNAANAANAQFNQNNAYQMQGAQMASNNYQSNIANMLGVNDQRMNAANSALSANSNLNNQKLQAAGMAGQTYSNQYLPSQNLAGVGQSQDAYNDLVLQSKINAWDRAQQQPLQNISNFTNILNGGGYNSTTTPVYSNTGAQILGGLSSLAGLFALCDIREKVVHSFLGYMPLLNGETIGIYQFTYRDDGDQKMWVGPMAQEVEEKTAAVLEFNGKKVINVENLMQEAA